MTYLPNIKGITSENNSTTTPLLSGGSFVGASDQNNFADVMVQVATDQNGVLYCEFSSNGTDWDTSLSFVYNTTRINPPHVFVKGDRYFRVRFENDISSLDQNYLRLNTYYGSFQKLTAPLNGTLSENFDAIVTRPTDFSKEVSMGKRQGNTTWNKWGYNNDVGTVGEEIIAPWGGTYTAPTTAETLNIVSDTEDDTAGGSGVNSIVVTGIDANRNSQTEVVNMDGENVVTTTSTWLGINRIAPFLCGSTKKNEGNVMITGTSSGDIFGQMPELKAVSQQNIFYVQTNHTFLWTWLHVNVLKLSGGGGDPEVTIRGYVYSPVANAEIEIFKLKVDASIENNVDITLAEPLPVTEQGVLYFTASTDKNNTSVDVRFSGVEVRNM